MRASPEDDGLYLVSDGRCDNTGVKYNRPPKGDRSEGFLSIFFVFCRFLMIFLENMCFVYANWAGMVGKWSGIYLEVVLDLGTTSKSQFWVPKPHFSFFQTPFLKTSLFTFPPNLTFFSSNLQIHAVQNVPMDRTDHFGFHHFFDFDLIFYIKIWLFWKKSLFQVSVKKEDFIGRHMLLFRRYYI